MATTPNSATLINPIISRMLLFFIFQNKNILNKPTIRAFNNF